MKKSSSTSNVDALKDEIKRLRKENKSKDKKIESLTEKRKSDKEKMSEMSRELKKKEEATRRSSEEIFKYFSNLFPDIDIR